MSRRFVSALLASAAVAAVSIGAPAAAPAAKTAAVPASVALATPDPHLGGSVSFRYVVNARDPRIAVRCYQNGVMGYAEAGTADHVFQLGGAGSDWLRAGGAAHCTVQLFSIESRPNQPQKVTTYAWTEFDAAG